jgi:hypothetical protein
MDPIDIFSIRQYNSIVVELYCPAKSGMIDLKETDGIK